MWSRTEISHSGAAVQHLVSVMNALRFLHAHSCYICQKNYIIWSYQKGNRSSFFSLWNNLGVFDVYLNSL